MRFRVTLSNDIEGDQTINNPEGWDKIKVKLQRHPKYHSLVEVIDVPLIFYGDNGLVDGGYGYIKRVLETQGINAIIVCLIENSDDEGETWEEFFEGNLELSDKEEFSEGERFYKLKCPIIQTSLWSNFVNREEIPVDLLSTTDLDGEDTQVPELIELNLIGQTIVQKYQGKTARDETLILEVPNNQYGQIDFYDPVINELKEIYTYSVVENAELPTEKYFAKYAGEHNITAEIFMFTGSFIGSSVVPANVELFLKKNEEAAIQFTHTNESEGIDSWTKFNINQNFTLAAGDVIRVYLLNTTGITQTINWYAQIIKETLFTITAQTVFPDTTTDALLIHDAAKSIVHRITGTPNDSFYSEKLGGIIHGYEFDGCDYKYALMKGKHVRGVSFASKSFFMSWKEFWEGADPIFNLGMGYEDIPPIDDQYGAPFSFGFDLGFES